MLYLITCIALRNSKHLRFTMNKSACRNESSTQLSWRCSTKEKLKISENKELVISVDVGEQPTTVHREVERADNILPNKKQLDKAVRENLLLFCITAKDRIVCAQPGKLQAVSWLASPPSTVLDPHPGQKLLQGSVPTSSQFKPKTSHFLNVRSTT